MWLNSKLIKNKYYFIYLLLIFFTVNACSDDSSTGPDPDPRGEEVNTELAKKKFVWDAMNYWYYWQPDVPVLAANKSYFDGEEESYENYLTNFSSPEEFFNSLLYNPMNESESYDRNFSFFIEDYEVYQDENRGINAAFGLDFAIISIQGESGNISTFGYVRYVVDGSPSDEAGLERGDIFTMVNGNRLEYRSPSAYAPLLESQSTVQLELAEFTDSTYFENGDLDSEPFELTGTTVEIPSRRVVEDPVYYSSIIDTSGTKIGYLVYNAFQRNSHQELNNRFSEFKSNGINTLVLDLRYNGGGSVLTSQILSSLISGEDRSSEFAQLVYREDRSQFNRTLNFLDTAPVTNMDGELARDENGNYVDMVSLQKLAIDHLYVLTGFGTASASEALINGLKPYMNVTLIGEETVGKEVGSITLFDSPGDANNAPYTNSDPAARDFEIALQPIVTRLTNVNGNRYFSGFEPNYEVLEYFYLLRNNRLPSLGNVDEPLLQEAISLIIGNGSNSVEAQQSISTFGVIPNFIGKESYFHNGKNRQGMTIEPNMLLEQ